MKTPTLVIGDLHGQLEIAQKALDSIYPVIFLGDFLDSFTRTVDDQIQTLLLVLNAVERGNARALMANHEMSYMRPELRCSGWNPATQVHVSHLQYRMDMLLEDYIWCEGFLITHAGVSQRLLDALETDLDTYLSTGDFDQIGRSRGGRAPCGGLRWCDWREFEPVEGVDQIVGHTRGRVIRTKGNNWCIDVLEDREPQGLLIQDGTARIIHLNDMMSVSEVIEDAQDGIS